MLITNLIYFLTTNALNLRKDKSILLSRICILSLAVCFLLGLNSLYVVALSRGVGLYGGLFYVNSFTHSFNLFVFLIASIIMVLTSYYPRKVLTDFFLTITNKFNYRLSYDMTNISNKMANQFRILEYSLIVLFVISGGVFLMSANDLISIFLSIELQSYALYILSTLYRDSERATEGGLTYFLLGGLSSCFILFGSSLLYVNSGTTNLDSLYLIHNVTEINNDFDTAEFYIMDKYNPYYIHYSMIILIVGFLFKISAAPFHFWSPDVYDSIPTIVTTMVAIIAKLSIFVLFLDLIFHLGDTFSFFSWTNSFLFSSLFSLIIGSVLGLTQSRIKRLYAYSTISHVGFILLALSVNNIESIQSYIFYILSYTITNLNAFIILVAIGYTYYFYVKKPEAELSSENNNTKEEKMLDPENSPVQLITQIKGYFYHNSYLALSLAITLFSFVGVPPLIGFFAKQMVLSAALDNGYVFMAIIAILTSVIGAVYYLNLIKQMFFFKSDYIIMDTMPGKQLRGKIEKWTSNQDSSLNKDILYSHEDISISSAITLTISILTLVISLFIFAPNEWLNVANILTYSLFHHE